mmetsp:Transcript_5404/g.11074  ORF Transcript_5404/g.11074 Transcript_5404/m.11074 type:complete len:772 (+) Transcript_5404:434-2749(+)
MFHSSGLYQQPGSKSSSTSRRSSSEKGFHPYKYPDQNQYDYHRLVSEPTVHSEHASNFHPHSRSMSTGVIDQNNLFYYSSEEEMLDSNHGDDPMDVYDPSRNGVSRSSSPTMANTSHLEVEAAEHLMNLLQRESTDYSLPLPVCYYPNEFDDGSSDTDNENDDTANGGSNTSKTASEKDRKSKAPIIGPWRRRIASWMYDVVDHFKYDRNVVSIALRYIDQYVSHLLLKSPSSKKLSSSGNGSSSPAIKRRHFQLIAVTSLYLAIKVHGELHEEDTHDEVIITSLVSEVDGFGMNGFLGQEGKHHDDSEDDDESDEDIRALSSKIADLKRRHRHGRLLNLGGSLSSQKPSKENQQPLHPIPFKPRKRGMLSGPLRLSSFVELSRGLFTAQDITDTETKILKALNYVVNPPTSRRFVGEMMRILALCSTTRMMRKSAAQLGLNRIEILQAILASACRQTEGASSVPALSLGCLPSVVGYSALLNAIDDEFDKQGQQRQGTTMDGMEEDKMIHSYQLEDFQRHYRRYARSQSAPIQEHGRQQELEKEQFLAAWKEQFLLALYHATSGYLAPDTADVFRVRELLDEIQSESLQENAEVSSPQETTGDEAGVQSSPTNKKKSRSPRSPRSVISGMTSARFRGSGSFFSRGSTVSNVSCSPYDAGGKDAEAHSSSKSSRFSISGGHNMGKTYYQRQISEPLDTSHHSHRQHQHTRATSFGTTASNPFMRAATPDIGHWTNNNGDATSASQENWRSNDANHERWGSEAFQPPPFFSA